MTQQEKRHESRTRALKGARIQFENGSPPADCSVRQLSVDGARIETDRELQIDDQVGLYFLTENITLMARVAWRTGRSTGLEFERPVPWLVNHSSD